MINKILNINILNKVIYFFICGYVILSCTEVLGAVHLLRVALFLGVIRLMIKPLKITINTKHFWYIAAFLLAIIFTIFMNGGNCYEGLRFLRSDYLGTMIPMICILLFIKKDQVKKILLCLIFSLCITNLYALWETLHGMTRVGGLAGGAMQLGGALILIVPLTVLLIVNKEFMSTTYRPFLILALLLEIPVVFFNATRIAWIALLIVIPLLLLLVQKNKKRAIVYSLILVVLFVKIGSVIPYAHERLNVMTDKSYQPNSERILMWHSAGNMFRDHPLTGVGLGNYKEQYQEKYMSVLAKEPYQIHAHNNIIHLAATTGVVGVMAYLAMFGYFLYESFRKWREKKTIAPLIFFLATLGFVIQGMTDYNIGFIGVVSKIYWMLLAIYLVLDGVVKVEDR
jgi:O-antigen ligase